MKHFYDYQAKVIGGKEINFKEFENQVVLVVNTASQ